MRASTLLFAFTLACTSGTRPIDRDAQLADASAPPDAGSDAGTFDAGPPGDGGPRLDDVLIYAHSRDTLYTFSAYTGTVTEIGRFTLPNGSDAPFMVDLAVNAAGDVYTSSDTSLYRVDPTTARATLVGDFRIGSERLFALTFLSAGEYRADREALIGATNAGTYYEVDPRDASTTELGQYPDGWSSSGDLVSIEGLGTFATLRRTDFPADVLGRILFASDGSSTVVVVGPVTDGTTDFTEIFGLGYWGRALYGFSNDGQLIEIDRMTGRGTAVPVSTGASQFWGAGVTTQAPILF
ncbi:MAG: hypothetical protein K8H88_13895 [Sandaracinaceae bacterium]|nr:hypothetical protein [Sandaracinaceae bacterium]